jgi:hypothetical protein
LFELGVSRSRCTWRIRLSARPPSTATPARSAPQRRIVFQSISIGMSSRDVPPSSVTSPRRATQVTGGELGGSDFAIAEREGVRRLAPREEQHLRRRPPQRYDGLKRGIVLRALAGDDTPVTVVGEAYRDFGRFKGLALYFDPISRAGIMPAPRSPGFTGGFDSDPREGVRPRERNADAVHRMHPFRYGIKYAAFRQAGIQGEPSALSHGFAGRERRRHPTDGRQRGAKADPVVPGGPRRQPDLVPHEHAAHSPQLRHSSRFAPGEPPIQVVARLQRGLAEEIRRLFVPGNSDSIDQALERAGIHYVRSNLGYGGGRLLPVHPNERAGRRPTHLHPNITLAGLRSGIQREKGHGDAVGRSLVFDALPVDRVRERLTLAVE